MLLSTSAAAFAAPSDLYRTGAFTMTLNDGAPITNEQEIRVSLWTHGMVKPDDFIDGLINNEIDITDVISSDTNYLSLLVYTGNNDYIYGGYITISPIE